MLYTEDIHEALNGGVLRSMTDFEHDVVCLTFTNENFTHWAVNCSLQYRSTEWNMLNKHDSMLWFDDLEDGGALKRFNQTSFFTKLSKKWKFYSAEVQIGTVCFKMGFLTEKHTTQQLLSNRNTKGLSTGQG